MKNPFRLRRGLAWLKWLMTGVGLLVLAGCCDVYTPYPLVRDTASTQKPANLPVGTWNAGPPSNLEARVGPDGHAVIGSLIWNKEKMKYELAVTEAWITPRNFLPDPDRGFISIRQQDEAGHPIERYGLLEYRLDGRELLVWRARPAEFIRAIEDGELAGEAYDDDAVLITSPKESLLEFLERPDHMLAASERYEAGPGGTLFFYTHPIRLQRNSEESAESTGAIGPFTGGGMTLKNPRPLSHLTDVKPRAVGLFSLAKETGCSSSGSEGIVIISHREPELQTSTTRIPATLGMNFGVSLVAAGTPVDGTAEFVAVWRFPQPGLADAQQTLPRYDCQRLVLGSFGKTIFVGYAFRHDWELVPGTWTLELWKGERRLLVQPFEVHQPAAPAPNDPTKEGTHFD